MIRIFKTYLLLNFFLFVHAYGSNNPWQQAVVQTVHKYEKQADTSLNPQFTRQHISYPPKKIALLAFKLERRLELWARDKKNAWHHIKNYGLTATSGHLGPKLKEYDKQIPEGIYHITRLNPFSAFHLSMMINYPNATDRQYARFDRRQHVGSNIFIHGKNSSVGCLAIGNKNINELFVLVDKVGSNNTEVVIAPNDLRKEKAKTSLFFKPHWVPTLYQSIKKELQQFPV